MGLSAPPYIPVQKVSLGEGETAIRNAASLMATIVRQSSGEWRVRYYATKIIGPQRPRSWRRELEAVRGFLQRNTRFLPDPDQTEFLQRPEVVLDLVSKGEMVYLDCDDYTILVASLLRSVGYPVRLRVVSLRRDHGQLTHVFALVWVGERWVSFDGTRADLPVGWSPEHTRTVDYNV